MQEMWKSVDNRYMVSNLGRIKSVERDIIKNNGVVLHLKEKILKPQKIGKYYSVYLPDKEKGKQVWHYVHRLVAKAFIPNPDNLPQVNHKDEDPANNRADNLEWCNQTYNLNYGTAKQRCLETKIKKGICTDYRGLTIAEKKEKQREKNRKKYIPRISHKVVLYQEVVSYSYVKVKEFSCCDEAGKYLGVDRKTAYGLVRSGGKKEEVKKYFLAKPDNTLFIEKD